jgi:hypothetical protein
MSYGRSFSPCFNLVFQNQECTDPHYRKMKVRVSIGLTLSLSSCVSDNRYTKTFLIGGILESLLSALEWHLAQLTVPSLACRGGR